jgi:hypothetical protein
VRLDLRPDLPPAPARLLLVVAASIAFAAGCAAISGPTASPLASPSVSVAPTGPAIVGACSSGDSHASGGPWGGAAGSRGADVIVTYDGATSCLLPPRPVVAMFDVTGTVVVQTRPVVATDEPALSPGRSWAFSILLSNWCNRAVRLPLRPVVVLGTGALEISGLAMATTDDLPPCNGPGKPAELSATDWEPR